MAYDTAIVLGTTLTSIGFLYLATKMNIKNWPVQILFILMSFIIFINTGGLMREIVNVQSIGGNVGGLVENHVLILVFGFMIYFIYMIVNFIFELVAHLTKKEKERKANEGFGARLGAT